MHLLTRTRRLALLSCMVAAPLLAMGQAPAAAAPASAQTQYEQAAQQGQPTGQGTYRLQVNANIVLTNVVVRDKKTGAVVKGLKASDFTVLENGKPHAWLRSIFKTWIRPQCLRRKAPLAGMPRWPICWSATWPRTSSSFAITG